MSKLTRVGLGYNSGKLIFACGNCNVDGLFGVGGNRRPPPRLTVSVSMSNEKKQNK